MIIGIKASPLHCNYYKVPTHAVLVDSVSKCSRSPQDIFINGIKTFFIIHEQYTVVQGQVEK